MSLTTEPCRTGPGSTEQKDPPTPDGVSPSALPVNDEAPLSDTEVLVRDTVLECLSKHEGCDDAEQRFAWEARKAIKAHLFTPSAARDMIRKFSARAGIRASVGVALKVARAVEKAS